MQIAGDERYGNVDATIEFLEIINNTFDILNSKSQLGRDFKSPITVNNYIEKKEYLNKSKEYLMTLRTSQGQMLYKSRRLFICTLFDA